MSDSLRRLQVFFGVIVVACLVLAIYEFGFGTPLIGLYTLVGALLFSALAFVYPHFPLRASHALALSTTLLTGLLTPEPFLTQQPLIAVLIPPIVAGIFLPTYWVVAYFVGTLALLIARGGWESAYLHPGLLSIFAIIIAGLSVARSGALLAAEATRFQAQLLDSVDQAVTATDLSGTITYWNRAAELLYGYSAAEALGRSSGKILPAEGENNIAAIAEQLRAGLSWSGELRARHREGYGVPVRTTVSLIHDQQGRPSGTVSVSADNTQELRYRLIAEHSADLIAILDLQGRLCYVSPSFRTIFDLDPAELVGSSAFVRVHPEDQAQVLDAFARVLREERAMVSFRYQHARGRWHQIEASGTLIDTGYAQELLIVGHDVTERLRLQEQLRQAQKMEAIGRLAGGIAHDFNNLLVVIGGYATMLRDELPDGSEPRADAEQIVAATERATALTRQLLAFARKQRISPQVLDLNRLLSELAPLLRRLIGEAVALQIVLDEAPCSVLGDQGQIEQVLINLAANARDAMPEGGLLLIEIGRQDLDEAYARAHLGVVPGSYAQITVSDTGVGMDETVREHLFEPFFTTKEQGRGTGLGLASAYGIVQQHGGSIWVYSEPGHGTTIKVYLPLSNASASPQQAAPPVADARGHERILLVEDEAQVRELIARALRLSGYQVIEARDGLEALALVEQHGQSIDLLLTDVVMPQLSGVELARRVLALLPELPILFMSGYSDNVFTRQGQPVEQGALVEKPFSPSAIAVAVRRRLDSRAPKA